MAAQVEFPVTSITKDRPAIRIGDTLAGMIVLNLTIALTVARGAIDPSLGAYLIAGFDSIGAMHVLARLWSIAR